MNSRALLLFGALLVSPTWSQEPAANTPVLTPRSFDLTNTSIKKIVRDAAASQSVPVQLAEAKPVERKLVIETEDVRPVETPAKIVLPRRAAERKSEGPLSALVGILVDEALGLDDISEERPCRPDDLDPTQTHPKCDVVPNDPLAR